ncbi:MAG: radical SAM protein [Vampirovibrionales bacterium]|nr:radical SAM protein [Vampirovibrionales bacterium]
MTPPASPAIMNHPSSSIYGPVKSWRVGASLGVDLLLETSTCSFNCIYCQLGNIQLKTAERKIYVATEQVEKDFKHSDWQHADIVTLSGSGEPTLALNIKEVIHFIKEYSGKPVMVLTNGTLLHDAAVRHDLLEADKVAIKLDAATEAGFNQMNRPVPGATLANVIAGAKAFRNEYGGNKPGVLCLQMMIMPTNVAEAKAMAQLAATLTPDEIQLNTPKRPYPLEWALDSRGNHEAASVPSRELRVINEDEARALKTLFEQTTGCPVVSVYRE